MWTSLQAHTAMPNKNLDGSYFDEDTLHEIMRMKMVENRRLAQLSALQRIKQAKSI